MSWPEKLSTVEGRRAAVMEIASDHDIKTRAMLELVGLVEVVHAVASGTYVESGIMLEEQGLIAVASRGEG